MYDGHMTNVLERSNLKSVIDAIKRREAELRELGLTALYIYGSRARGDHHPDSDLDVLIDYNKDRLTLLGLAGVQHIIGDDTGLEVHAATSDSFPPEGLKRVEPDLVRVF